MFLYFSLTSVMEVGLIPTPNGNNYRQTNQPTDQQTDRRGHREVTPPLINAFFSRNTLRGHRCSQSLYCHIVHTYIRTNTYMHTCIQTDGRTKWSLWIVRRLIKHMYIQIILCDFERKGIIISIYTTINHRNKNILYKYKNKFMS